MGVEVGKAINKGGGAGSTPPLPPRPVLQAPLTLCPVLSSQAGLPSELSPATHNLHSTFPHNTFFTYEN